MPKMFGLDENLSIVMGLIVNTIMFTVLSRKNVFKVFLTVFVSMVIYGGTDLMCVSMIMSATHISLSEIQNNPLVGFLVSTPERMIQYSILYLAAFKKLKFLFKNRPVDVSLISIVKVDKDLTKNSTIVLVVIFIYILFLAKLVAIDGAFLSFSPMYALFACSMLFIIPFVVLMAFSEVIVRNYINRIAVDMYEKEYKESQRDKITSKLVDIYDEADKGKDEKTMKMVTELLHAVNN